MLTPIQKLTLFLTISLLILPTPSTSTWSSPSSQDIHQKHSPPNITRTQTMYRWCDCGSGLNFVEIWPNNQIQRVQVVAPGAISWIRFGGGGDEEIDRKRQQVRKISWRCDGMKHSHSFPLTLPPTQYLSILSTPTSPNPTNHTCNSSTTSLHFNTWTQTPYISSIPFTSHTEGYACFKIPTMIKTIAGTIIAFSQGRRPGCDDFDRTDLVYRRSVDGGRTWGGLGRVVEVEGDGEGLGYCGHKLVIGNISPVQLRNDSKFHPNRILAPYTRNNFKLWITYSDDDGLTWHQTQQIPNVSQTEDKPDCNRNMSYFGYKIDQLKLKNFPAIVRYFNMVCKMKNPFRNTAWTSKLKGPWQFIGVGPSQSLQLRSGRILVPGYHSPIRGLSGVPKTLPISQLYNNFAKGFVLISDDDGQNWRLGKQWPIGEGANQHQLVQLNDGTVLSNSRSLSTGSPQYRLQARSLDEGQTFLPSEYTKIPQPFGGCQGSTAIGQNGQIYVTSPNPKRARSLLQYLITLKKCQINLNGRQKLSLWISQDNGRSYKLDQIIDHGLSAQTSLQYSDGRLLLLYEQADQLEKRLGEKLENLGIQNLRVLLPTRFVFREVQVGGRGRSGEVEVEVEEGI